MLIAIAFFTVLCLALVRMLYVEQSESDRKDTVIALYRVRNKKLAGEAEVERQRARDLARDVERLKRQIRTGIPFEERRVDL